MPVKKRGLGRGLNALIGDVSSVAREKSEKTLTVDQLRRGRYQPRRHMDQERLQELADSINAQGIIQPILVRTLGGEKYEIVAGERRWRAAQLAGIHEVPVLIRDISDQAAMALGLIENIQREDLNPLEEAEALNRLLKEFKMTHQQVADSVGKSRTTITNLLRLMDLQARVKTCLQDGLIEMGHARALLGLQGLLQVQAAERIMAQGLSVRATEKLVRDLQAKGTDEREAAVTDPDIKALQTRISEKLGARVSIQHKPSGKGRLVIRYNTVDELEGVLDRLK
jgi:ParB family chromosome partitioning protein